MSNIIHICTGFSLDYQGGITNYVRSIAEKQAENGHKVFVLADQGQDNKYKVIKFITKIKRFSFYKKKDNEAYLFLDKLFSETKFDLVHIHMMLNMDSRILTLLHKHKLKFLISLHDYFYICPRIQMVPYNEIRCETANTDKCKNCFNLLFRTFYLRKGLEKILGRKFIEMFPLKDKKVYEKRILTYKPLLERADKLIAVSNRVAEIYKNSGIENHIDVLHIGNVSALDFKDAIAKKNDDVINIVFLSNASELKGGKLLCELIKKTRNPLLKFHFFGRSSAEEENMLRQCGVNVHGPYKQTELPSILNDMDMGAVLPIREDNAPQIVMEMLNNRLPVFATSMGGITDFVDLENGYLFNPFDDQDKKKAIEFLNNLTKDEVYQKRCKIRKTLTPQEHYEQLMDLYEEVIHNI